MIHIVCSQKQYNLLAKQKSSVAKPVKFEVKKRKLGPPFAFDDDTGRSYSLKSLKLAKMFGPSEYSKVGDMFVHVV